ncbi:hypothetical protein C5613_31520 [Rhodococcus opacus]|uniref:Uncharacterized protein n=1 Tax=Rhodococcus opacus TaxID=37919 RepID=A0A2S8IW47_RHOOP|nr:hypothetical protein C5613_31520 [Rhodococcus opacus]
MTTPAGIALAALLLAAPPVSAAPTDTVLPIPFAGLTNGPTGFTNLPSSTYITASTDPDEPGITRFRCGAYPYCDVFVHWRNLATGTSGAADLLYGSSTRGIAQTGSGTVVAAFTAGGMPGYPGTPTTFLPGAGVWAVP